MTWHVQKAVKHLIEHALGASAGKCAAFTRMAIEAGGVTLVCHKPAKNYRSSLIAVVFALLLY